MVHMLWKTIWSLLRKLNIQLPCGQEILFLGIYLKELVFSIILRSLPASSVCGILQARILEWVAIPFSRGFPDPGIKPRSPSLQADSLPSEPLGNPYFEKRHPNKYMYMNLHMVLFTIAKRSKYP